MESSEKSANNKKEDDEEQADMDAKLIKELLGEVAESVCNQMAEEEQIKLMKQKEFGSSYDDMTKSNVSSLLQTQLCCSCVKEKAVVICTICVEATLIQSGGGLFNSLTHQQTQNNNGSNDTELNLINLESHIDNLQNKDKNELDVLATRDKLNKRRENVEKLIKNGNLVYCLECYDLVHKNKCKSHMAVDLFESNSNKDEDISGEISNENLDSKKTLDKGDEPIEETDDQQLQVKLEETKRNIKCLNDRCDQFNDVKQSIRQMNDLIKDDLYIDFGSIAVMMKSKMDELSDKIKEKLKDAYSVVRDTQNRLATKLNETKKLAEQLDKDSIDSLLTKAEINEKLKAVNELVNQINEELKTICSDSQTNFNSINSCSLFLDHNLYPQFNYYVDTTKLVEAINDLNIQIKTANTFEKMLTQVSNMDSISSSISKLSCNVPYDCLVTSGISTEGIFWVQLLTLDDIKAIDTSNSIPPNFVSENQQSLAKKNQQKITFFIDELSKYIRRKRISDKTWQTYTEASKMPKINDKCFCLEPKTRKWLRATIETASKSQTNGFHVRYMDTGSYDALTTYTGECMLLWKEFELGKIPPRSIKCVLAKMNDENVENDKKLNKFENEICLETKFLFKDLTMKQSLVCLLIEKVESDHQSVVDYSVSHDSINTLNTLSSQFNSSENAWIVKLYKTGDMSSLFREEQKEGEEKNQEINQETDQQDKNNNIIDLKYLDTFKKSDAKPKSINELILEYNDQEKSLAGHSKEFKSVDIRLETGELKVQTFTIKTNTENTNVDPGKTPDNSSLTSDKSLQLTSQNEANLNKFNETISSSSKLKQTGEFLSIDPTNTNNNVINPNHSLPTELINKLEVINENTQVNEDKKLAETEPTQSTIHPVVEPSHSDTIDIEDQTDERRAHKPREGNCIITSYMEETGIFWIQPHIADLDPQTRSEVDNFTSYMNEFVEKTKFMSYGDLHVTPEVMKKCFVRHDKSLGGSIVWSRGFIEKVINQKDELRCKVRLLDHGCFRIIDVYNVFPHRRLGEKSNLHKLNYIAIRCCLSKEPISFETQSVFRARMTRKECRFKLIEQVPSDKNPKFKSWLVELYDKQNNKSVSKAYLPKVYKFQRPCYNKGQSSIYINSDEERLKSLPHESSSNQSSLTLYKKPQYSSLTSDRIVSKKGRLSSLDDSLIERYTLQSDLKEEKTKRRRSKSTSNQPNTESKSSSTKKAFKNFLTDCKEEAPAPSKNIDNNQETAQQVIQDDQKDQTILRLPASFVRQNEQTSNPRENSFKKRSGNNEHQEPKHHSPRQNSNLSSASNNNSWGKSGDFNKSRSPKPFNPNSKTSSSSKYGNNNNCKTDYGKNNYKGYHRRDDDDDNYDFHNSGNRARNNYGSGGYRNYYNSNSNNNQGNHGGYNQNQRNYGNQYQGDLNENEVFLVNVDDLEDQNDLNSVLLNDVFIDENQPKVPSKTHDESISGMTNIYIKNLDAIKNDEEYYMEDDDDASISSSMVFLNESRNILDFQDANDEVHIEQNKYEELTHSHIKHTYEHRFTLIENDEQHMEEIEQQRGHVEYRQRKPSFESHAHGQPTLDAATTLDITQQVADRHANIYMLPPHNRIGSRLQTTNVTTTTTNYEYKEYKETIINKDYFNIRNNERQMTQENIINNSCAKNYLIKSSSSSSLGSSNKKKNEAATNENTDDNESYASCAEELLIRTSDSNSSIVVVANDTPDANKNIKYKPNDIFFKNSGIEFTFDVGNLSTPSTIQIPAVTSLVPQIIPAVSTLQNQEHSNKENTNSELLNSYNQKLDTNTILKSSTNQFMSSLALKLEKMKSFKTVIFIDSFDDYSFNSGSSLNESTASVSSSSSLENNNATKLSNIMRKKKSGSKSLDHIDHIQKKLVNLIDDDEYDSLSEFEKNELEMIKQSNSTSALKNLSKTNPFVSYIPAAQLDDEEFTYYGNPNHYMSNKPTHLASKPPVMPNSIFNFQSHNSNTNINNNNNNQNYCLSTITECSNETFETCSNQSSDKANKNKGTTNNNDNNGNNAWNSSDHDEYEKNLASPYLIASTQQQQHSQQIISSTLLNKDVLEIDLKNVTIRRRGNENNIEVHQNDQKENDDKDTELSNGRKQLTEILAELLEKNLNNKQYQQQNERIDLNELLNSKKMKNFSSGSQNTNKRSKSSSSLSDSCFTSNSNSNSNSHNYLNQLDSVRTNTTTSNSHQLTQILNPNIKDNTLVINRKTQLLASVIAATSTEQNKESYDHLKDLNENLDNAQTGCSLEKRQKIQSALLTDKVFEKFCVRSNDEIMNCNGLASLNGNEGSGSNGSSGIGTDFLDTANKNNQKLNTHLEKNVIINQNSVFTYDDNKYLNGKQIDNKKVKESEDNEEQDDEEDTIDDVFIKPKNTKEQQQMNELPKSSSTPKSNLNRQLDFFGEEQNNQKNKDKKLNNPLSSSSSMSFSSNNNNNEAPIRARAHSTTSLDTKKNCMKDETLVQKPQMNNSSPAKALTNTKNAQAATNNVSTTTLEISSYTSDSLFNSHLMITPMCISGMDASANTNQISPTQLGSFLLKSQSLIQSFSASPLSANTNSNTQKQNPTTPNNAKMSNASNNNKNLYIFSDIQSELVKHLVRQQQQQQQQQQSPNLLPPLPSPPTFLCQLTATSPSQSLKSQSNTWSTLPPPPPLPPQLQQSNNNNSTDLNVSSLPPTPPPPPPPPQLQTDAAQPLAATSTSSSSSSSSTVSSKKSKTKKANPSTTMNIAQGNTANLIESLTARLNLINSNTAAKPFSNIKQKSTRSSSLNSTEKRQITQINSNPDKNVINNLSKTNKDIITLEPNKVVKNICQNTNIDVPKDHEVTKGDGLQQISKTNLAKFTHFENYLNTILQKQNEVLATSTTTTTTTTVITTVNNSTNKIETSPATPPNQSTKNSTNNSIVNNSSNKSIANRLLAFNEANNLAAPCLPSENNADIDQLVKKSKNGKWKSANFSLYGLDDEEEEENQTKANNEHISRRQRFSNEETDQTPFSNNKKQLYPNISCIDYDFGKTNNTSQMEPKQNHNDRNDSVELIESISLPPPPSEFKDDNVEVNPVDVTLKQVDYQSLNSMSSLPSLPPPPPLPQNPPPAHIPNNHNISLNNQQQKKHLSQLQPKITNQQPPPPPQSLSSLIFNDLKQFNYFNSLQNHHSTASSSIATTVIPNMNYVNQKPPVLSSTSNQQASSKIQAEQIKQSLGTNNYQDDKYFNNKNDVSATATSVVDETSQQSIESDEEVVKKADQYEGIRRTSFKLDHLLDINPKRLYVNSKFRCRIHDVINERGQFWLEVLYGREEEAKFIEIFKLFRLCSRISLPPTHFYINKRVSACYKGDWYRAIIVDDHLEDDHLVRVRFLDLGINKVLNKQTELRDIDEKFFNCPTKALKCSILMPDSELRLNKESRKFFTRLIYKKCLYAKIVAFTHPSQNETDITCKIILGCQTQRGIIDVNMYMLSKFYRDRYEMLKRVQKPTYSPPQTPPAQQKQTNLQFDNFNELLNDISQGYSSNTTTMTPSSMNDSNVLNERIDLGDIELTQLESHQKDNEYYNDIDGNDDEYNEYEEDNDEETDDYELFSDLRYNNKNKIHQSHNLLNIQKQVDEQHNLTLQDNSSTYFSVIGNENENSNHDDDDNGLDYTPVKDDQHNNSNENSRKYNYSGLLRFESIHLPDNEEKKQQEKQITKDINENLYSTPLIKGKIGGPTSNYNSSVNKVGTGRNGSTAKVSNRSRLIFPANIGDNGADSASPVFNKKAFTMPPSRPPPVRPPPPRVSYKNNNNIPNYSSDTDSSLHAPCCSMPLKFKWHSGTLGNSSAKNSSSKGANNLFKKKVTSSLTYEGYLNDEHGTNKKFQTMNQIESKYNTKTLNALQTNVNSKKVKFQMK